MKGPLRGSLRGPLLLAVAFSAALSTVTAEAAPEQDDSTPEACFNGRTVSSAVSVSHGGKTYRLANDRCRAQFLSDPERYAQLYDALLELEQEGQAVAPPRASLVPS